MKPSPGLNLDIFSKKCAIDSAAGHAQLDFTRCGVSALYTALKRFDKRFSRVFQDVTDPVSLSVPKLSPPPLP